MQQVQFYSVTPEQLQNAIIEGVKTQLESLKLHFQPRQPKTYLSRAEVSKMLNVSFVTLNKWNKYAEVFKYSPYFLRQYPNFDNDTHFINNYVNQWDDLSDYEKLEIR